MQIAQAANVVSALFAQHFCNSVVISVVSILFALIATRCLPKVAGAVRAFFWSLILARCLVACYCDITIPIPVAPEAGPVLEQVRVYASRPLSQVRMGHINIGAGRERENIAAPLSARAAATMAGQSQLITVPLCLFLLWVFGAGLVATGRILAFRKVYNVVRKSKAYRSAEAEQDVINLAAALSIRRPRLLVSSDTQTPFAFGAVRPVIVMPVSACNLSRADMRMTLAHELGHIRRLDPLLGLIPELARIVFFFNPFVYIAVQEYLIAREEACDQIAVALTSSNPRSYAELLLRHIVRFSWTCNPPTTATMSCAHRAMKRRLLSLKSGAPARPNKRSIALQACLPLVIIPWQASMRFNPSTTIQNLSSLTLVKTYLPVLMSGSGLNVTNATAINLAGDVIGVANKTKAVLWHSNSLVPLDGGSRFRISVPSGISDTGLIVGSQYNNPDRLHGYTWTPASHTIPNVQGFRYIEPIAVNGAGDIVGDARSGSKDHFGAIDSHAFLMKNGQMTDLGTLGGQHSCALSINASDVIVGKSDVNRGIVGAIESTGPQTHAFEWTSGQMKDLGTLGGSNSLAYSVSNDGDIAGYSDTIYGTVHAFLYQAGAMRDLGPLPGDDTSVATFVNDRGQAVGYRSRQQLDSTQRAVLWSNGYVEDLNTLLPKDSGWVLQSAHAVNDKGEIVGRGTFRGRASGFLLVPSAT